MNTWVPPSLLALELGPEADERAIRRAYAKRLKQVDPEADPAGFQALRETLESALEWAAWRARDADEADDDEAAGNAGPASPPVVDTAPAHAPPMPVAVSAPAPALDAAAAPMAEPVPEPDPGELAFAGFHLRLQRGIAAEDDATKLLEASLADPALVNLEARTFFEWRVACLLASGWQPGHEFLFRPASTVFSWDHDRRRLALFGPVGALLDAAIRERLIFFAQDKATVDAQRQLMRRLRVAGPGADFASQMPLLGQLLQRFPSWTRTMTRQEVVQQWVEAWNALTPPEREAAQRRIQPTLSPPPSSYKTKSSSGWGGSWAAVLIAMAVIRGISAMGDHGSRPSGESTSPPPRLQVTTEPPAPAWASSSAARDPLSQLAADPGAIPGMAPVAAPAATGQRAERVITEQELEALVRHAKSVSISMPPAASAPPGSDDRYRLDRKTELAPGQRFGANFQPQSQFRLTPSDGSRLPGLADLAHPPPPPPPPADPAR